MLLPFYLIPLFYPYCRLEKKRLYILQSNPGLPDIDRLSVSLLNNHFIKLTARFKNKQEHCKSELCRPEGQGQLFITEQLKNVRFTQISKKKMP